MQHNFGNVPQANIQRSSFDRSSTLKTTFDADDLVPIFLDEVLPGDTHVMKANLFGRLATPINPIMDNMTLSTFFFFVPTRLIFANFEKFMGAQDDPGDSTDFTIPMRTTDANIDEGSPLEYMGLPIGTCKDFSVLPLRCYDKIYNEWFRDQNLQDSIVEYDNDTSSPIGQTGWDTLHKRGKRFDYFTSCLTSPQKGAAVNLPLGTSADIHALSTGATDSYGVYDDYDSAQKQLLPVTSTSVIAGSVAGDAKLYADLSSATAATINDLRTASQVQRLMEVDARSGSRYVEKLKAHFGVTSPDFRLQRSEYLGGGTSPINITPIAQQSSTDATTPQGKLAAMGTVSGGGHGFSKSFTEHGFIFGLDNV